MPRCPNCRLELNESDSCPICGYPGRTPGAGRGRPAWIALAAGALAAALFVVFLAAKAGERIAPVGPALAQATTSGSQTEVATDSASGTEGDAEVARSTAASSLLAYNVADQTEFPSLDSKSAYIAWMLAHTKESEKFLSEKWDRTQIALRRGDIRHRRVLIAFLETPREDFVRKYNLSKAYDDTAIPIGYGQTISGPHIVARMTDALDPLPNMRVLEIGTGSGYQSAFLSELSNYVYTIEIVKPLERETDKIYRSLYSQYPMYQNIHRRAADGYYGWPQEAPFDRIIVTAAIDHIPPDLLKELAPNGIMVIPIGPPSGQVVLKITKIVEPDGTIRLEREDIYHGTAIKTFVPFTAENGGVHSLRNDRDDGQ